MIIITTTPTSYFLHLLMTELTHCRRSIMLFATTQGGLLRTLRRKSNQVVGLTPPALLRLDRQLSLYNPCLLLLVAY